jgi:hypothetical protein
MDPRVTFARMFSPDASGWGNYGSPAMQSLIHDQESKGPMLTQATQSMAIAPSITPISRSLVDQQGNPIQGGISTTPTQQMPAPQGESQQGQQVPAQGGATQTGASTTTMLLLGGGAFLAVMLLMKRK